MAYYDDAAKNFDSYFLDMDNDAGAPLLRVFFLFKILLVNLCLGCAITVICLSTRRYLGNCLSYIACGLCDDCYCDYDVPLPSTSTQMSRRRSVRKRDMYYEDETIGYTMWIICKAFCSNKKLVKTGVSILLGMLITYSSTANQYSYDPDGSGAEIETPTPIHSFSNHTLFSEDTNNPKRVFFVTPTPASGIQNARLIRIAQSLFPSRRFITWVIVSADPIPNYLWNWVRTEHWSSEQIAKWKRDEGRVMAHLEDIYQTVSRLGIPFVILSSHGIHHSSSEFARIQLKTRTSVSSFMKAAQVGLSWVVKTFGSGVILVGPDDAVYNFQLFPEVQGTRLMSSWPSAFDPRYSFSLSTPLLKNSRNVISGYFVGGAIKELEIPLQYASYAITVAVAKRLQMSKSLWKLTIDNLYSSTDLSLKMHQVQPLAQNCSEIYVWKISTTFANVNRINIYRIPLKFKWTKTNVGELHNLIRKWFAKDINESGA